MVIELPLPNKRFSLSPHGRLNDFKGNDRQQKQHFLRENKMELSGNQAALILGASKDGEISVDVAGSDLDGLPGALCQAIAVKLMEDENFQAELMGIVEDQEG